MIWLRLTAAAFVAALALAAMVIPPPALAGGSGDIMLMHPWSRPAAQGQNGAVYLDIANKGAVEDKLVGASSPVAEGVEIHLSTMEDGIHRMREVESIAVPAGGSATLAPGGYRIMLIGLKSMLMAEESFPVTLTFEKAGDIGMTVSVEDRGGGHGDRADHDSHGGHGDDGGMAGHGKDH